jgi:hypothetical protein
MDQLFYGDALQTSTVLLDKVQHLADGVIASAIFDGGK